MDKYIIEQVAEYFNIEENKVKTNSSIYPDECWVLEKPLEVVHKYVAYSNEEDFINDEKKIQEFRNSTSLDRIGRYKRLCNDYYFRWL